MRRAITAAVVSVLMLGGVTATPAFAAEHGANKHQGTGTAQPAAQVKAKTTTAKTTTAKTTTAKTTTAKAGPQRTVIYHGYEFKVPASWPVYRLDQHPSACVRYDINAVYLGTPGVNMKCPAGLIGHAQTVSVLPGTTVAAGSGSEVTYQRAQPDGVGSPAVRSLKAVRATVTENSGEHELRVALALGATVLGTYGADPAVVEKVLATLRTAPKGAAVTAQTGSLAALSAPSRTRPPDAAQATVSAIVAARSQATGLPLTFGRPRYSRAPSAAGETADASKGWPGIPPQWPIQIVSPPPKPKPGYRVVSGFDTCNAPSLATMRVWRRAYAAIGVYIGGENRGCPWGNLSAAWFKSASGLGWGMLPLYVGAQAPCTSATQVTTIDPGKAAAEGRAAAASAVADAQIFGLGAGTPVYYDMEAYVGDASCHSTVLKFLGAWDRALSAAGYVTAVYSSEDSAIADMQAATIAKTPGFTTPDAVWVAKWDGISSVSDASLGDLAWPLAKRVKQYQGVVNQTVGGIEMNVDLDVVAGPMAG